MNTPAVQRIRPGRIAREGTLDMSRAIETAPRPPRRNAPSPSLFCWRSIGRHVDTKKQPWGTRMNDRHQELSAGTTELDGPLLRDPFAVVTAGPGLGGRDCALFATTRRLISWTRCDVAAVLRRENEAQGARPSCAI